MCKFMSDEIIRDVWELYGVHSDPFSTAPILVKGGVIPLDCFVGRDEQIKQLGKIFGSRGGSRILISGDVGVGKTSFVNIVRRHAIDMGFFSPFKEIAVQNDWTPNVFILNTLGGIFSTIKVMNTKPLGDTSYSKLESLIEVAFNDSNVNIGAFGFEFGYMKDRKNPSKITSFSLIKFFEDICTEIRENTGHDIIIHYNNLELLSEADIKKLFGNLRDFFQTEGVHFVYVGNLLVRGYFQSMPRFSSILTDTSFKIETFTYDEIREIIYKRFEVLKIEGLDYVVPCTDDCLRELYDLFGGNIRYILNSLTTAVHKLTSEKSVIIDENLLAKTLKNIIEEKHYNNITEREKDVLYEIIKQDEITIKSIAGNMGLKNSNVSTYVKDLEANGCVYLKRKNGKDKFWSAEHKLKWMRLKEKHHVQKPFSSYLN